MTVVRCYFAVFMVSVIFVLHPTKTGGPQSKTGITAAARRQTFITISLITVGAPRRLVLQ